MTTNKIRTGRASHGITTRNSKLIARSVVHDDAASPVHELRWRRGRFYLVPRRGEFHHITKAAAQNTYIRWFCENWQTDGGELHRLINY